MRPRAYYHFPIETTTRLTLTVESILFQEQNDCRDSLNSNANRVYIHIYTYIYDAWSGLHKIVVPLSEQSDVIPRRCDFLHRAGPFFLGLALLLALPFSRSFLRHLPTSGAHVRGYFVAMHPCLAFLSGALRGNSDARDRPLRIQRALRNSWNVVQFFLLVSRAYTYNVSLHGLRYYLVIYFFVYILSVLFFFCNFFFFVYGLEGEMQEDTGSRFILMYHY